jgi:hypothetical protein
VGRSGKGQLSFQEPGLELRDEVLVFGVGMVAVLWAGLGSGGGARQGFGGAEGGRGRGRDGGGELRELGDPVFALLPAFRSENVEYVAEIFPRVGYGLDLEFLDGGNL